MAELLSCSVRSKDLLGFVDCLAQVSYLGYSCNNHRNTLDFPKGLSMNLAHPSTMHSYPLRIASQVLVVQLSSTCIKLALWAQSRFVFIRVPTKLNSHAVMRYLSTHSNLTAQNCWAILTRKKMRIERLKRNIVLTMDWRHIGLSRIWRVLMVFQGCPLLIQRTSLPKAFSMRLRKESHIKPQFWCNHNRMRVISNSLLGSY